MKRYVIFLLVAIGSAATAIAAISPSSSDLPITGKNVTVIEKNQAFPLVGPLIVSDCSTEDCVESSI